MPLASGIASHAQGMLFESVQLPENQLKLILPLVLLPVDVCVIVLDTCSHVLSVNPKPYSFPHLGFRDEKLLHGGYTRDYLGQYYTGY